MENNSKFTKIALAILLILLLGYSAYATYSILDLRNRNENIEKQLTTNNEQATTDNKNESLKVTEFTLNGEDIKLPEGWYLESIEDNPYQYFDLHGDPIKTYDDPMDINSAFGPTTIYRGQRVAFSNGNTTLYMNDENQYSNDTTATIVSCIANIDSRLTILRKPSENETGLFRIKEPNKYTYILTESNFDVSLEYCMPEVTNDPGVDFFFYTWEEPRMNEFYTEEMDISKLIAIDFFFVNFFELNYSNNSNNSNLYPTFYTYSGEINNLGDNKTWLSFTYTEGFVNTYILLDQDEQKEFSALDYLQKEENFIIKYDKISCDTINEINYCKLLTENVTFEKIE